MDPTGNRTTMQIGELAKHIGVSARSLRYYEQQELLSPSRAENGYREYGRLSIIRAANIKQLFAAGLTSADVRLYIESGCLDRPLTESPRCLAELDTVQHRLSHVDERIAQLQGLRQRLVSHRSRVVGGLGSEPERKDGGSGPGSEAPESGG